MAIKPDPMSHILPVSAPVVFYFPGVLLVKNIAGADPW